MCATTFEPCLVHCYLHLGDEEALYTQYLESVKRTWDQSLPKLSWANWSLLALYAGVSRGLCTTNLNAKGYLPCLATFLTVTWLTLYPLAVSAFAMPLREYWPWSSCFLISACTCAGSLQGRPSHFVWCPRTGTTAKDIHLFTVLYGTP